MKPTTLSYDETRVSNEDLYAMCIQGEEGAWQYVYTYVLAITRWSKWNLREQPEDLAQSIVLYLMEKGIHKAKQKSSFRAFVKKVAVNKILDSFKAPEQPDTSIDEILQFSNGSAQARAYPSADPSPEQRLLDGDLYRIIETLFTRLPEYCGAVLKEFFRYKMGLHESYEELSAILDRPIGTISAQIRRCLDSFSKHKEIREYL